MPRKYWVCKKNVTFFPNTPYDGKYIAYNAELCYACYAEKEY
jgi:hypothetical protein